MLPAILRSAHQVDTHCPSMQAIKEWLADFLVKSFRRFSIKFKSDNWHCFSKFPHCRCSKYRIGLMHVSSSRFKVTKLDKVNITSDGVFLTYI